VDTRSAVATAALTHPTDIIVLYILADLPV
jgi:hypothetical protein